MLNRLIFAGVTAFWVTMSVMLWRSEFTRKGEIKSAIPTEKVWEKVLTAPDASSLEILHHGKKVGYCSWSARAGEQSASQVLSEDFSPEDNAQPLTSYSLELAGNVSLPQLTNSPRFDLTINLSTNQAWENMRLHVSMRPHSWEVNADAKAQRLALIVNDDAGIWDQTYKFSDLQNPQMLMDGFGIPWAAGMIGGLGLASSRTNLSQLSLGLKWHARYDTMRFGHSRVGVYRLETHLLDRYIISIFVSRVGEILWVELPGGWVLSNVAFSHF